MNSFKVTPTEYKNLNVVFNAIKELVEVDPFIHYQDIQHKVKKSAPTIAKYIHILEYIQAIQLQWEPHKVQKTKRLELFGYKYIILKEVISYV